MNSSEPSRDCGLDTDKEIPDTRLDQILNASIQAANSFIMPILTIIVDNDRNKINDRNDTKKGTNTCFRSILIYNCCILHQAEHWRFESFVNESYKPS
jgi:hypothetical protein